MVLLNEKLYKYTVENSHTSITGLVFLAQGHICYSSLYAYSQFISYSGLYRILVVFFDICSLKKT